MKIGDKIELNIKEDNKPKNEMEDVFKDILSILNSKVKEVEKLKWCSTAFEVLEQWYKEDKMKSCKMCKSKLIPILYNLIQKGSIQHMASFFDFYKRAYQFSARRDFECFIDCFEWDKNKQIYGRRREILQPYVDALNRIAFDDKLKYVIASFAPSMGKSYIATLFSAFAFGLSIDNSIIRLSYSEELVLGFSRTIKDIITSPEFAEIFTNFKIYKGKVFDIERESDWKIKNANVPKSNHISRTRSGSTTGERASFAIIFDDMTKGSEEANSEAIHRGIYDKWNTEWWNRRDGDKCKFIFIGTQWCPEDILNRIIIDRNNVSKLLPTNNPYVLESEDTIVIRVPMLDAEGKTTCAEVYPQEVAENLQRTTDPFLFSCVYQQDPIAPTGREFAYECIRTYETLPSGLSINSFATLDPARKGKDNVSMPIFRSDGMGGYYLVDAIFKKKAMDDLYDEIVDKIINNEVTLFVIENNTDTSLKRLIEDKLKEKNYFVCEIREKYNSIKKETRIKDNRGIVQKQLVFPDKGTFPPNSDIGRMMDNLTKYSFDYPNKNDDAPDSICMFASEIVLQKNVAGRAKAIRRPF